MNGIACFKFVLDFTSVLNVWTQLETYAIGKPSY